MPSKKLPHTPFDVWGKYDPSMPEEIPELPCCYVVYANGNPCYVGQTNNARRRIQSHNFNLMQYSSHIETAWGVFKDVFIKCKFPKKYGLWAMIELRLIKKMQPKFNQTYNQPRKPNDEK